VGPFISVFKHTYDRLLVVLNYISVIIIFLTALWITADVVGRYFFNSPIPGTVELVETGILGIFFFGITYTLQQGRHVRTDVLVRHFPPAVVNLCSALGCLIGAFIFAIVCQFGWEAAWKAWLVKEFEGVQIRIPTYPSRFVMVLGSGLLVIQFTIDLIKHLLVAFRGRKGLIP
jgi:TRAP-type C4-dicarboxylate transport system permease small subunit